MKLNGSVLIIAFYYPPYPKVGSRRWVKFAKYLNRQNKSVFVLVAQMDVDKNSPWDKDAAEIEHLTTRLHFKYKLPYFKKHIPVSLFDKVRWKCSQWLNKFSTSVNGNPSDTSEKFAPAFLEAARKIILEKKVTTVIFTASPNHLAYYISTLKNEFKEIKFLFDLRDYWVDWMQHLEADKIEFEKKMERQTILLSDRIISPAEKIIKTLKMRYPEKAEQMSVLPHAFDEDDFLEVLKDTSVTKKHDEITLVYAGTMYNNMQDNMAVLAKLLGDNKRVRLLFYTFTDDYKDYFSNEIINGRVEYIKPLPVKEFLLKVNREADGLFYMRSSLNDDNNFLSSKFFDFLPLKKPIIYLGGKGDALKFIEQNKIGFHLDKDISGSFEKYLKQSRIEMQEFDFEKYSFNEVTKQLIQVIEN